ncbi:MAG: hypothetical protein PHW79_06080 [Candidatus Marinimicrobia bacterium]|nr:hypothetical protein [Candidatus Neomarinimicrobiota bacterium]
MKGWPKIDVVPEITADDVKGLKAKCDPYPLTPDIRIFRNIMPGDNYPLRIYDTKLGKHLKNFMHWLNDDPNASNNKFKPQAKRNRKIDRRRGKTR